MQTVLITGANGFVGFYLCQQLLQKGYTVLATGKGGCRLPFKERTFIYQSLDFTDDAAVSSIFEQHRPITVVHCGAISKPDECEMNRESAYKTNVTGTIYLLKAAAKYKSHFIFLSTDFVFSGEKGMYTEEEERKPVNFYGETKVMAEDEVKKYAFGWTIVRTVLVYGKPYLNRQNILTIVAAGLQKNQQLNIFNDQVRTPTYVEDLATALISIIEKKAKGVYHISGEDVHTPYEMALAVAQHLKLNSSLINKVEEKDLDQPARRPLKTGFDISKAKKELGYQPVTFKEGLKRTFE